MTNRCRAAERLLLLRTENHFTQNDVAVSVGYSRPVVTQWETGTRLPSVDALWKLADLYNVTVDYLIGRSDRRSE